MQNLESRKHMGRVGGWVSPNSSNAFGGVVPVQVGGGVVVGRGGVEEYGARLHISVSLTIFTFKTALLFTLTKRLYH